MVTGPSSFAICWKGGQANTDRAKDRDKWKQTDRPRLSAAIEDQANEAGLNRWRDAWGMLLGFVLLAIASIAWLQPAQPRARKIVGGIIICAELLLVFITYLIQSARV